MTNVSEHIEALLIEHDCVIVKGLGAFVASRVSAMVDKKRGVMLPPRKEVVFNRSLIHNDGMLVGYIAMQECMSTDDALFEVEEYVAKVKKQLQINGCFEIEGVGVLRRVGKEVTFVEDKNNVLLADSYGYVPLAIEEQRVGVRQAMQSKGVRSFATTAAVLACLLAISPEVRDGGVGSFGEVQSGYTDLFESPMTVDVQEPEAVLMGKADMSVGTTNNEVEEQVVKSVSKYYIVVGSFVGHSDADKYIAEMSRRGVEGLLKYQSEGRRVRVVAGEFDNHDVAREMNNQLRRVSGFEKSWILTVNQ